MPNEDHQPRACTTLAASLPRNIDLAGAAERTRIMLGCYRDWGDRDPEIYTRAIVSVLPRYPECVAIAVTEPATGIPSKIRRQPEIADVVEACEVEMAPILRQYERDHIEAHHRRALPAPPEKPKMTIEEMEAKWGRKFGSLLRRVPGAPIERDDGGHAARIAADLAARRVRNEMQQPNGAELAGQGGS
jgi:hypothetical protein